MNTGPEGGERISPPTSSRLDSTPPVMPRPFSSGSTACFVLLAVVLFLFRDWSYFRDDPMERLYYPVETALWLANADMTYYEAWRDLSSLERWLFALGTGPVGGAPEDCEEVLSEAIEFVARSDSHSDDLIKLRATRAILLAETGAFVRAEKDLQSLESVTEATALVRAVRALYTTNAPPLDVTQGADPSAILGHGWARWRLQIRWFRSKNDATQAAWLESWLDDQAEQKKWRALVVSTVASALVLAGFCLFAGFLIPGWRGELGARQRPRVFSSATEGFAVFVRAFALGTAAELVLGYLTRTPLLSYSFWFGLPAVALLWHRYWRTDPTAVQRFFGTLGWKTRVRHLVGASLALFALDWLALDWVGSGVESLGFESHWAEAMNEAELFGPGPAKAVALLNGILWAPIFEELIFRGILFSALRVRLSLTWASTTSGLIFGAIHLYSLPGFLAVSAFGVLNAIASEKTGSLIPCVVVHVLTNLLLVGGTSWIYS